MKKCKFMRPGTLVGFGLLGMVVFACGSEKEEETRPYDEIAAKLREPTGTLDSSNAVAVAEAFQASNGASTLAGGRRITQAQAQGQRTPCTNGGDLTIIVHSSSAAATSAEYAYNECCYAPDCCYDGGGTIYYAGSSIGQQEYCSSYDISLECLEQLVRVQYSACFDGEGTGTFLIEVDTKTYAVSGSYFNGSGTLTIKDSKGTYTCTYSGREGSCTGSGSFSF